jgi:hypothetical protein
LGNQEKAVAGCENSHLDTFFSNLPHTARSCHSIFAMALPSFPSAKRSPRTRLGQPIPALLLKADGRSAQAELQTVSLTGGLLHLSKPLCKGDLVELTFHAQPDRVQGLAQMLGPLPAAGEDIPQAFRFIAMADDDHRALRRIADKGSNWASVELSHTFPST